LALWLSGIPVDAIWLRVHPFGATSGPVALRRHIEACREFHALGLPLIGDYSGTIGLALLAFGAVGGITGGITYGERFDAGPLLRPRSGSTPFAPQARVYVSKLGAFLTKGQAATFFDSRQMKALFACRDRGCCHRGASDTQADPKRHFIIRRSAEVAAYSRPPAAVRPALYLEDFLRPATDLALRAVKVEPALETTRRRLEAWRHTLGAIHRAGPPPSVALTPEGRRVLRRHQAGA
jgi:hypothetical protein